MREWKHMVEEFTYVSAPDFSLERKENTPDFTQRANWARAPRRTHRGCRKLLDDQRTLIEPIDPPPVSIITAPSSGSINTPDLV
jgi:hypothetical protein